MSKVIFLEDDAGSRMRIADWIREEGYEVIECRNIVSAMENFDEHREDVVCVITDLNMDDFWLQEFQQESGGGMFSGWVWLQKFVYSNESSKEIPTVIYSGYIDELRKHLLLKGKLRELKRKNIVCVNKGTGEDEGYDGLIKALRSLGIGDERS